MSGAAIILWQNKLMARFRDAGAISPSSAQSLDELYVHRTWIFRRMLSRGIFVQTADGRHYMDEARAQAFVARRRVVMLTMTAALLVVFAIVMIMLAL